MTEQDTHKSQPHSASLWQQGREVRGRALRRRGGAH
jgi:hypothetical protein